MNWDNCLIHKPDYLYIHHLNRSHLHPLYKVHQLCKNLQLQHLHHNSNLWMCQIHMNLGNYLIHIWDLLDIVHDWYNSHRVLNKNGNHSIQLLHYLHLHNWLKIITVSTHIKLHSWLNLQYSKIWINLHFFGPKVHFLRLLWAKFSINLHLETLIF